MNDNPNTAPSAMGAITSAPAEQLCILIGNELAHAIDARNHGPHEYEKKLSCISAVPYTRLTACMDPILPYEPFASGEPSSQIVVIVPMHTIYMAVFREMLRADGQRIAALGPGMLRIEPAEYTPHERTIITGFLDDGKVHPAGDPAGWGDTYLRSLIRHAERVTIEPRTKRFREKMWVGRPTHAARSVRIICHRRGVKKWAEAVKLHAPNAEVFLLSGPTARKRLGERR